MKLKKFAAAALAAVLSLTMLTACGGGGGNGGGEVTVKEIDYQQSQTCKWLESDKLYFEYRYEGDPEFTSAKSGYKGDKNYTELYTDGVLQMIVLADGEDTYALFTPECAYYQGYDSFADGKAVYMSVQRDFDLIKAAKGDVTSYRINGVDYYAESFTDGKTTMAYCYDKAMKLVGAVCIRGSQKVFMIIEGELKYDFDESKLELPKDAINLGAMVQ